MNHERLIPVTAFALAVLLAGCRSVVQVDEETASTVGYNAVVSSKLQHPQDEFEYRGIVYTLTKRPGTSITNESLVAEFWLASSVKCQERGSSKAKWSYHWAFVSFGTDGRVETNNVFMMQDWSWFPLDP